MHSVFSLLESNFDLCNQKLSPDACKIRHQLVSAGEAGNDPDSAADDPCYQLMRCIFYEANFHSSLFFPQSFDSFVVGSRNVKKLPAHVESFKSFTIFILLVSITVSAFSYLVITHEILVSSSLKATHLKCNFHFAPSTTNCMLLESYLNSDFHIMHVLEV